MLVQRTVVHWPSTGTEEQLTLAEIRVCFYLLVFLDIAFIEDYGPDRRVMKKVFNSCELTVWLICMDICTHMH